MKTHYQVLIVGGGNAGIACAAQLLRKRPTLDVAIIEPSEKHYYQPAWTLVGGGVFNANKTVRAQSSVIPKGATWIKAAAHAFIPEQNQVVTTDRRFTYDFLVVAPGIQLDWHKIKGLAAALGQHETTSNYRLDLAPYTFACLKGYRGGKALFTAPSTPIKCGGAPQKIMYLAADYFRKHGTLQKGNVQFYSGGTVLFGVKEFAKTLHEVVARYGIQTHFGHNLVAIDGDDKVATFEYKDGDVTREKSVQYEMIHVTPPQSAPDFIKGSPLAMKDNPLGWIDVHKGTLQHVRYPNIFAAGDATNTPNAKTGAAIRKQVPILVQNLLARIDNRPLEGLPQYNGYGSCPLVTGYGKLVLAEFDYDNRPMMTFPFDQAKERWSMWMLKKHILPWMYWHRILKGTA